MTKRIVILFFVILALVMLLRIIGIDKGYNSDEGWLLKTAQLELGQLIPFLGEGRSVYPPLSPSLFHLWMKVSDSEVWLRCYFVLFGSLLCVVIFLIGRIYKDERFGLSVFFLSAVSPLLIWSSQFIRSYIDSAFWITLSTYFMLKILKDKGSLVNCAGYIISSSLALYSSYLNILILVSQSTYVLVFYIRNWRFLRKWIALKAIIAVTFIPCLFLLLKQMKLATAIDAKWSERGFQIMGFSVGYYARSVAAIFGMDPSFLAIQSLAKSLNRVSLILLAVLAIGAAIFVLVRALNNFRAEGSNSNGRLIWFFPFISLFALLLYVFLVEFRNYPLQPEYFIPQHILFLFVIASFILPVKKGARLNRVVFILIALTFVFRFPEAIKPEFETKRAYKYLTSNFEESSLLLLTRKTNRYLTNEEFNIFDLQSFIEKNSDADYYRPLNQRAKDMLMQLKSRYKDIWFHRVYGNDEILGANGMIIKWLKSNGYREVDVQKFRRIDLIRYRRG